MTGRPSRSCSQLVDPADDMHDRLGCRIAGHTDVDMRLPFLPEVYLKLQSRYVSEEDTETATVKDVRPVVANRALVH